MNGEPVYRTAPVNKAHTYLTQYCVLLDMWFLTLVLPEKYLGNGIFETSLAFQKRVLARIDFFFCIFDLTLGRFLRYANFNLPYAIL